MKKSKIPKTTIIIAILVVVIIALIIILLTKSQQSEISPGVPFPSPQTLPGNTIEIRSGGIFPGVIVISAGETVNFINRDNRPHRPASDIHPTHRLYPGSGIEKCGTPDQSNNFDACRGLAQGEFYSFTFNEVGSWSYHDHLNPGLRGIIIVQ